jgi:hypothetical protein
LNDGRYLKEFVCLAPFYAFKTLIKSTERRQKLLTIRASMFMYYTDQCFLVISLKFTAKTFKLK